MLGREVNLPVTLMYKPPEWGSRGRSVCIRSVQDKLKSSQKSMRRDCDFRVRKQTFKVGDLVYWQRNVGNKVESVWRGPGVII